MGFVIESWMLREGLEKSPEKWDSFFFTTDEFTASNFSEISSTIWSIGSDIGPRLALSKHFSSFWSYVESKESIGTSYGAVSLSLILILGKLGDSRLAHSI